MNLPLPFQKFAMYCGLIFLFFGIAFNLSAQIKKGKKLMEQGVYEAALRPLKKEFYSAAKNTESGLLLAKCFYALRKYPDALNVMQSIDPSTITNPDNRRFFADILIANDDFSSAYLALISLLSDDQSDPKTYLWLDKVSNLLTWDTIPSATKIQSIAGLNTVYNDYAPYNTVDGNLIFVTDANTVQAIFPNAYTNQSIHLYYQSRLNPKHDEAERPVMLMKKRDYYYHDGPMDKWPNHAKYAFTLREIGAPGLNLGIYFSTFSGGEDDLIPFKYNGEYNTGHPAFNKSGTRLIFATDRPGGYGQMDLWYTDWIDETWSKPVNMGPKINTPYNEVFPVIYNHRLYFSSDRRDIGYGALDLYYSNQLLGYDKVYNLRTPINSAFDDFAPTFRDNENGLFSSNRRGGTGGDDIYGFVFHPFKTVSPLARLKLQYANIPPGTPIEVRDEADSLVLQTTINKDGVIVVENLNAGELYTAIIEDPNLSAEAQLSIFSSSGNKIGRSQKQGSQEFQFMLSPKPLNYATSNPDYGRLEYEVNGKLVAGDTVKVGNVPISLIAPGGNILASTKTASDGSFKVGGIKPGEEYTIQTKGLESRHQIDVYGKSGAIKQTLEPFGKNRFAYTRALPPAAWMTASVTNVANVEAALSGKLQIPDEVITLYNEQDSVIGHPEIGKDNRLNFGTLTTGHAYRLNFSVRELNNQDRIYILDSSGDTAQTVRPFDAHNYFFEYMLNTNYSRAEPISMPEEEIYPSAEIVYKLKIDNYKLGRGIPFVLRKDSTEILDTIYATAQGVLLLRELQTNVQYQVELCDTSFASEKSMKIYNETNTEVYQGPSQDKNRFLFSLLDIDGYHLPKKDNPDNSFLKFRLSGTLTAVNSAPVEIRIFDSTGNLLSTIYTTDGGAFIANDLPRDEKYIIRTVDPDPNAILRLYTGANRDSIVVAREPNGDFLVRMNDLTGKSITVLSEDKKEVKVSEGVHFKLPEVFYDFNSYYLKAKSRKSIDRLYVFLSDNPKIRIEIQSHTDSRGPANYNKLLSQRRAESVVKYLTNKGIAAERMESVGMGETALTNKCNDGVRCTEAEHAANRRTEFVILSESK